MMLSSSYDEASELSISRLPKMISNFRDNTQLLENIPTAEETKKLFLQQWRTYATPRST